MADFFLWREGDGPGAEMRGCGTGKTSVLAYLSLLTFPKKKNIYIYTIGSSDFQDLSPSLSPLKIVTDGEGV